MIATTLRLASLAATAILIASFAMFVVDESRSGSDQQLNQIAADAATARVHATASAATSLDTPDPSAAVAHERARRHGRIRNLVDRADDILLAPFVGVISSNSLWVERTVPALLALLVFGFGLRLLAGYVGLRR